MLHCIFASENQFETNYSFAMKQKLNSVTPENFESIIKYAYEAYQPAILSYITYRIHHKYDAEDLTQDVFMRLLDYKRMIRPETVKYFLFTIARNIVTDHLRRYYKKQEIDTLLYDTLTYSVHDTEDACLTNDLLSLEKKKLETFAPQRLNVYRMSRFEEQSVEEIAVHLNLSRKTVENHLLLGRKEMRGYIRKCI